LAIDPLYGKNTQDNPALWYAKEIFTPQSVGDFTVDSAIAITIGFRIILFKE
jgi:hypothetical protein